MKVKFLSVALSLVSLWLASLSVQAQDKELSPNELLDPNHSELNLNEDKTLLFEHESKPKGTFRDSAMVHDKPAFIAITPSKSKTSEHKSSNNSKEEEDALSFNFLYYIIQKFKISDLIDE